MFKKRLLGMIALMLVLMLIAACGGKKESADTQPSASAPASSPSASSSAPADAKPYAGQTVKMLMPPWYKFTPDFFQKFTDQTGIKVEVENMKFSQIHDNIVTTSAGGSAPADIVDIDWSWVGQMGAAKWNVDLKDVLADDVKSDIGILSVFTYKDNIVALPFFNDFRISMVNSNYVGDLPVDTVEHVIETAKQIKASGKDEYPIVTTLEAGENTTHEWMLMTKSLGGQVFDDNWNLNLKDKNSPSYKALSYIFEMFNAGLIDPKALGIPYEEVIETFKSGRGSIKLLAGPGQINEASDPATSQIKDYVKPILVPGDGTHHTTTAMPEGIMIPAHAEHKEAAIEVLKWLASPDVMKETYKTQGGIFPTRNSVIQALFESGDLPHGDVYAKQLEDVQAIFLQGQPSWYAEFSEAAYTAINSGLKEHWSVDKTADMIIKATENIDKG
ncbi:ABC transporter substrate-binding protein [Cohnella caldifontis]|uniref:ABC transporter substrate-binding protein n=1 Tax=Cohnella caldifontis TaxID=3027471 RepID=UPI0023EC294C|nr:extracellular solute-binding protein [Cohnella sp. YIM B05605]